MSHFIVNLTKKTPLTHKMRRFFGIETAALWYACNKFEVLF
jgi:hypothetical protein